MIIALVDLLRGLLHMVNLSDDLCGNWYRNMLDMVVVVTGYMDVVMRKVAYESLRGNARRRVIGEGRHGSW